MWPKINITGSSEFTLTGIKKVTRRKIIEILRNCSDKLTKLYKRTGTSLDMILNHAIADH